MRRRLPPLNSLRALEATSRHLNFVKAAEELAVTPAAVNQQVRQLEERIGKNIFIRKPTGLELTAAGCKALPLLSSAFDMLEEAVSYLDPPEHSESLSVSATSTFASRWIIPRLAAFQDANPSLRIRVDASDTIVDFSVEQFDLAIRFGRGNYPELTAEKLMPVSFVPACSPKLLQSRPLNHPADLLQFPLIHYEGAQDNLNIPTWDMWGRAVGVDLSKAQRGLLVTSSVLAADAAVAGYGVALSIRSLIAHELDQGLLVTPLCEASEEVDELGYYLVYPQGRRLKKGASRFREWIIGETGNQVAK